MQHQCALDPPPISASSDSPFFSATSPTARTQHASQSASSASPPIPGLNCYQGPPLAGRFNYTPPPLSAISFKSSHGFLSARSPSSAEWSFGDIDKLIAKRAHTDSTQTIGSPSIDLTSLDVTDPSAWPIEPSSDTEPPQQPFVLDLPPVRGRKLSSVAENQRLKNSSEASMQPDASPAPPLEAVSPARSVTSGLMMHSTAPETHSEVSHETQVNPAYRVVPSSASGSTVLCEQLLIALSTIFFLFTLPFSLIFCIKIVREYERAVVFRLGRLFVNRSNGPGLIVILPCIDRFRCVDLRTKLWDVPPQEILTRDSVTVAVDAVVYYRINNASVATINVEDYERSTHLLAATILRTVLGTKSLSEILSDREQISLLISRLLDEATEPWGVKVERVEVKDVRLPSSFQRVMAAEAEANREARAKLVAAEGELKASRPLKQAALIMSDAPTAFQLRYLQTLQSISSEKNSTISFPLPITLLRNWLAQKQASQHLLAPPVPRDPPKPAAMIKVVDSSIEVLPARPPSYVDQ